MNQKDYLEKTKKLAKITRILCRIAVIASAVGCTLLIASLIVAFAVSPDRIKPLQDQGRLSIFMNGFYVPADIFTSVDALRAFLGELTARMSVGILIFILVAIQVMGLLKSVEDGAPFVPENVTRLRKISIQIIIGSVLIPAVTSAAAAAYSHQSLMDIKSNSVIDVTLLLCGFLVLILSGVFAYGARLQREHDQMV
jgi:hypothetical protein